MSNFITDCIHGDALLSEVDDYIDTWHDLDSEVSLHEFLGMSKSEYELFIQDDAYLAIIITAHKNNSDIHSIIRSEFKFAARADNYKKSTQLENWLRREGLWEE